MPEKELNSCAVTKSDICLIECGKALCVWTQHDSRESDFCKRASTVDHRMKWETEEDHGHRNSEGLAAHRNLSQREKATSFDEGNICEGEHRPGGQHRNVESVKKSTPNERPFSKHQTVPLHVGERPP